MGDPYFFKCCSYCKVVVHFIGAFYKQKFHMNTSRSRTIVCSLYKYCVRIEAATCDTGLNSLASVPKDP